jgi:tRNA dimethylallyltransferase
MMPPMERRTRVVAIVGPTAAGKTRLALRIAPAIGGEIISADSRQVYRYLDIGTGKATAAEQAAVPHHLIDVVDPDAPFDVAEYVRRAEEAAASIVARGRVPIICGGSGLYVRAFLRGLFRGPRADDGLRARLETMEGVALHDRLAADDPVTAARVHRNDRVRIVRALEVRELTGVPISVWQRAHGFAEQRYDALVIGVEREPESLRGDIAARCAEMVERGLVDEVRHLWAAGYGPELRPLQTLGYRHMGAYLRGEVDRDEALGAMIVDTCRYAKRQRTWFRRDGNVVWFGPDAVEAAVGASRRFVESGP